MGGANSSIHYTLSVEPNFPRQFKVVIEVVRPRMPLRFAMPVWTPGSYTVMDFVGQVHSVEAHGVSGQLLELEKLDKTTWEVRGPPGRTVRLSYFVRAHDVAVDRSYVDGERATINGASAFMYVVERKEEPVTVTLVKPRTWKVYTGLKAFSRRAGKFRASDYDELVDCPIMMGRFETASFKVDGVEHRLVLVGPGNHDTKVLVRDVKRIVEETARLFRDIPYEDYTFFMEMAPRGDGGLEHRNSTHMIFPRWGFKPRSEYLEVLLLISHEFFHTWNVKRLQPLDLGPFDYSREVYSPLLWFSEGFTSYYEALLLRRSGCISAREYLDELGRHIRRLEMTPGRHIMTLEESSIDAWTKFYNPHPDSPNLSISYYNKGALLAWAVDMEIRYRTRGDRSLDDVMRLLYRRFYLEGPRGFATEDVEEAVREVAGSAVVSLFETLTRSKTSVDYDRFLRLAGLTVKENPGPSGQKQLPAGYLGIRVDGQGSRLLVRQVLADGPCYEAGIHPGDELIAMDDVRLDEGRLDHMIGLVQVGRPVRIFLARGGVIRDATVTVAQRPPYDFSIQARKGATRAQREVYQGWTGEALSALPLPHRPIRFRPREKVV